MVARLRPSIRPAQRLTATSMRAIRSRARSNGSSNSTSRIIAACSTTGGGVLFAGDLKGNALAYDASTGKQLWSFYTGSGYRGGPVTYTADGHQYVLFPAELADLGWASSSSFGRRSPIIRSARRSSRSASTRINAAGRARQPPPFSDANSAESSHNGFVEVARRCGVRADRVSHKCRRGHRPTDRSQ